MLGEVLFPVRARVATASKRRATRWSVTWHSKIRPWIPATVAVVALMAAVIGYGVVRSGDRALHRGSRQLPRPWPPPTRQPRLPPGARIASALPPRQPRPPQRPPQAPPRLPRTTTATIVAVGASEPAVLADRKTMVAELRERGEPRLPGLHGRPPRSSPDDSVERGTRRPSPDPPARPSTGRDRRGVRQAGGGRRLADHCSHRPGAARRPSLARGTDVRRLPSPRRRGRNLVDLLRSIGASVGLVVGLILGQPAGTADASARLLEHKTRTVRASRRPTPQTVRGELVVHHLHPAALRRAGRMAPAGQLPTRRALTCSS